MSKNIFALHTLGVMAIFACASCILGCQYTRPDQLTYRVPMPGEIMPAVIDANGGSTIPWTTWARYNKLWFADKDTFIVAVDGIKTASMFKPVPQKIEIPAGQHMLSIEIGRQFNLFHSPAGPFKLPCTVQQGRYYDLLFSNSAEAPGGTKIYSDRWAACIERVAESERELQN